MLPPIRIIYTVLTDDPHECIPVTAPSARHLFLHPFPHFIRPPGFSTYFITQNGLPTSAVGASVAAHHQPRSPGNPCEGPELEAEAGGHTPLLWPCPHHAGRVIIKNFVRRGIELQRIKSPPRLFKKAYVYAKVLHDRKDVTHLVWRPPHFIVKTASSQMASKIGRTSP